jgi:peroxiredoxin
MRCYSVFPALLVLCAGLLTAGELSGRRAPGFSLPDTKLEQHDLYDYRGKIVLLDIMQTTCPTCAAMTTELERIKANYAGKVVVLAVAVPPDTLNTINAFVSSHGVTGPVLFDSGQMAASYMKVGPQNPRIHLPHLFLIDAEGMIQNDWGEQEAVDAAKGGAIESDIDRLLAPKSAPSKKSGSK